MSDNGMMYDGLVRCPFCGAENTDAMGFIKHTDDCYLMLKYMGVASNKQLKEAWNHRPTEAALRAKIAELQEKVDNRWSMFSNGELDGIKKHQSNTYD